MSPWLRIEGLPDLNVDDTWLLDDVEGWWNTPAVRSALVPNGGGHGSIASGQWTYAEKYTVLTGTVILPADQQEPALRALKRAFPIGRNVWVEYHGDDWEIDKKAIARCYDTATFNRQQNYLEWAVPLVHPDPITYALNPVEATMGTYTGETLYRTYLTTGTTSFRTYGPDSSRQYQQADYTGMPASAVIEGGDVVSPRLSITVFGPTPRGWYIRHENTGNKIRAKAGLEVGESMEFDMLRRTVYRGATDITHLMSGDWLTVEPARNVYRFTSSNPAAYAVAAGLPAYL